MRTTSTHTSNTTARGHHSPSARAPRQGPPVALPPVTHPTGRAWQPLWRTLDTALVRLTLSVLLSVLIFGWLRGLT